MTESTAIKPLQASAKQARKYVFDQIYASGSGHPGGSLSCIDVLVALYLGRIKPDKAWISRIDRDHVILSKGHAVPALYSVLALCDLIPEEELKTLRHLGSRLQGHPDRSRLVEVEMSTGSLGQGLSVGIGQAQILQTLGRDHFSFVILGDGELNSGQVWEAIAYAGSHQCRQVVAIIDANGIQNDGRVEDIQNITPYIPKLNAFGWAVTEINGQDMKEVVDAIDWATCDSPGDRPRCILAHTTKGAGVSFMENKVEWHSHALSDEEYQKACEEVMQ